MTRITRLQITAEIDGAVCHIKFPAECQDVLIHMIQSLSGGSIEAVKLPDSFRFATLGEALQGAQP